MKRNSHYYGGRVARFAGEQARANALLALAGELPPGQAKRAALQQAQRAGDRMVRYAGELGRLDAKIDGKNEPNPSVEEQRKANERKKQKHANTHRDNRNRPGTKEHAQKSRGQRSGQHVPG